MAHSPPVAPSNHSLIGQSIFGEYTVTSKLGEGGMGTVYLAEQNSIGQKVALKVLHADAARDPEIIQRFHREARVISMLTHPNIIRVFIFGRTDSGHHYLAMEYVDGKPLSDTIGQQPMDELLAIRVMKQLCSALSEAHDLGIIHRDLKPDNILLTSFRGEDHFVKILDFGIAKIKSSQDAHSPRLTQANVVYGTPEYLSPEQAMAKDLDHRTDIYSLGVILYQMMTGNVPFRATNPISILNMHVSAPIPEFGSGSNPSIAPTMEQIIFKAMAKSPDERFANAMQMYEAFVQREQEILDERALDHAAVRSPGSELTDIYRASDVLAKLTTGPFGVNTPPSLQSVSPSNPVETREIQDVPSLNQTIATPSPFEAEEQLDWSYVMQTLFRTPLGLLIVAGMLVCGILLVAVLLYF